MIENAIRSGKIEAGESNQRLVPKKKENEVNNVSTYNKGYSKSIMVNQPGKVAANQQGSSRQESSARQNTEKLQFTLIPVPYKELYKSLFDAHIVSHFYLKPLQPPYPKWYDANAQCGYHAGITGHSIENCTGFKKLVERLISIGVVKIDDSPNVKNLLPNHTDKGVNMITGNTERNVMVDIAEVRTPLKWVWKKMVERRLISLNLEEKCRETKNYCKFHHEKGHEIQECTEFRTLVQSMMDNKEVEFYEKIEEGESICSSELTTRVSKISYPVVIILQPRKNEVEVSVTPKIIIKKPEAFPYKNNKKVPWSYACNTTVQENEILASAMKYDQVMGSYTRSGKRYDLISPPAEPVKGKTIVTEQEKEKEAKPTLPIIEPVKEEEAKEFLKFLKHGEYSVVEQLHKQPARISVLALLLSSEVHRKALMKVLNETYVANDISVNKLDWLVNNISADNFIFFNDDEIPPGGMGSTKALHITTQCTEYTLPGVLIDNGSILNVLPLSTLNRLPMDSSHMKTCQNIVRAFNDTERKVIGKIKIPLLIDPTIYEVDFLVMDIRPSYNCLLRRPWIHSAGAVPSSLYQKLKLVSEGRLVTINAEEDIIAAVANDAPYLEANDDAVECSFRSLEFVNATFISEGSKIPMPKIYKTTKMGLQLLVGRGALPGKGLGRCLQGRTETPVLKEKQDCFGLGYKPDIRQRRKELEKRQERRRARLNGKEVKLEPMIIPHISKTFKAVKGSAIAKFLASRALEDYEPLNFDFSNGDLMYVATAEEDSHENHPWKLSFDRASNAIGNGIGAVLVSPSGDHYLFTRKLDFDCTNNIVEYEACIMGIRAAIERKIKILEVYGDSALVIY
ncbi:uncharacterized protein [Gossypium hirsutum]|uniref:G-patch domain-containing protein n=1 Tax=Gossypium hirsutum TaxID=3635 RepID=A0ABM3A9J5_GOSHI|nr:uncharacterized protein LOC121218411 [Gossypium hirsutum]